MMDCSKEHPHHSHRAKTPEKARQYIQPKRKPRPTARAHIKNIRDRKEEKDGR